MKHVLMFLIVLFSSNQWVFSQCTNAAAFGSAAAPTNATPLTITTCVYQQEYNTITGVAAATTYSSSNSAGGCITVHQGTSGGPVVGFGPSPLSWTSTVAGTYYIHYNTNCACGMTTGCTTSTITCTSCGGGGNPCTSITPIAACGTSVTANMSGTGAGWNIATCGFTTSGQEMIYSFTPTTSGIHSIDVTSATGGFVDFFWKPASAGCSNAGWNCIDDIFSTGNYGSMNWVAGTTYYILLDPEGTGAYSFTFDMNCPVAGGPCTSITNIGGCGMSINVNLSGTGAPWNVPACGFSTPGTEIIFSYTATQSGIHSIDVTSASGGFVDFFWAPASAGCSSAGWNCIDDIISTGNYGSMNWVAGTTYYILLDPEGTGVYNFTFDLSCPNVGPVTAGDCASAIPVCTNLSFSVDPSGFGLVDELCTYCTSNPGTNPASANFGCLNAGELNSTWLLVNVAAGGTLEFSFGAPGGGVCFDWAMWPYNAATCANISANTLSPARCNWNSPCDGFTGMAGTVPVGGAAGNFEPIINAVAGQQYIICFSNYSSALTNVPMNFFGTSTISCSILPVELLSFSGKDMEGFNELNWVTASEINNSHFDLERSKNGIDYEKIGVIEGAGNSLNALEYKFNDYSPEDEVTYYRLNQFDFNGEHHYSDVVAISQLKDDQFNVVSFYPNPTNTIFNIQLFIPENDLVEINISDIYGKQIQTIKKVYVKGSNLIGIPVSNFTKGIYTISLVHERTQKTEVIKLAVY